MLATVSPFDRNHSAKRDTLLHCDSHISLIANDAQIPLYEAHVLPTVLRDREIKSLNSRGESWECCSAGTVLVSHAGSSGFDRQDFTELGMIIYL